MNALALYLSCHPCLILAQTSPAIPYGLGVLAIVIGITLWLMGKRLARPACAGVWMLLGMAAAGAVCQVVGDGGLLPLWLVVGGVMGGALGWLLYRICLAMALCVVLGLTAPAAMHLMQEETPSSQIKEQFSHYFPEETDELVEAAKEKAAATKKRITEAVKEHTPVEEDERSILQIISDLARAPWEKLRAHWDELPDDKRTATLGAAGIGALAGFLLGLLMPRLGASAGSALLGTLFMAGGSAVILAQSNPELLEKLDSHTSQCLMALGLITLAGIGIQWTLQRRKTDN